VQEESLLFQTFFIYI